MKRIIQCLLIASVLGLIAPLSAHATGPPTIGRPFQEWYDSQQGFRLLGNVQRSLQTVDGYYSQYFEKGRIEDHRYETNNPAWKFMFGRLGAELVERGYDAPVGGDASSVSYQTLQFQAFPEQRKPAPKPAVNGPIGTAQGVFVPYDAQLRAGPGHYVLPEFWRYINDAKLFPGGWLHDIGLPLTEALPADVTKAGVGRKITVQAFERAILTYDPQNPAAWRVERDNIGVDFLAIHGQGYSDSEIIEAVYRHIPPSQQVQIQRVEGRFARARVVPLNAQSGDAQIVFLHFDHGHWTVIRAGSDFPEGFYTQYKVPGIMQLGSGFEQALVSAVDEHVRTTSAVSNFDLQLERIEGGVARLQVLPLNVATDSAYVYARLVDRDRWSVIGGLGTGFSEEFYLTNDIPFVLRLSSR